MQSPQTEQCTVEERIERLEAASRRLRAWTGILSLTVVLLGGEALRAGGRAKQVVAEEFLVKDGSGVVRGRFGLRPDGLPEMAIHDEKGQLRAALHMYCDRGAALTFNDHGDTPLNLESPGDGSVAIRMRDGGGRTSSTLFMSSTGTAGLSFDHEKSSVLLGVNPNLHEGVVVTDDEGRERGRLGSNGLDARSMGVRSIAPQEEVGIEPISVTQESLDGRVEAVPSCEPTLGLTGSMGASVRGPSPRAAAG
ncbi:MAG: hypothetical protein SFX72_22625 [Isosphaeraceae bacterium]|nr:hypothetical protein [Isosphaeraceae bacterium]